MLRRFMHNRELRYAFAEDNRIARPFGWGTEFVGGPAEIDDPREFFRDFSSRTVENSGGFFFASAPKHVSFDSATNDVTWTSSLETSFVENNTVYGKYFPAASDKRAAVLVLPHWNAKAGSYFDLCKIFNRAGLSALRLTLPYHEKRNVPGAERADNLVAPNVGLTLQSLQQSVVDSRSAVAWLKSQGYERIGIVGTSIGSCVGFFAFVHDMNIDVAVFNHVSGYPADVVWHGITTRHVREGLGDSVTLPELREYWLPISPMAYIDRLASLPERPQRYIYTLYDLSFPVNLSRDVMAELRRRGVKHSEVTIPCGHYTLGEKPWVYYDGFKIVSFLRRNLMRIN
jgi:nicotinamidase-related amidase